MEPIVEVKNLTYTYPDGTRALQNVSLAMDSGSYTILLGRNGSGKTTLIKHLNGLLRATEGEVLLHDRPIGEWLDEEVFRRVGVVLQNPDDQIFASTVAEDVAFGPMNLDLSVAEVDQRVKQALEMTETFHLRERSIHHLSYGQKKRVAIAGVLAMQPDLMVLDEPAAGLDPQGEKELLRLIRQLNHSRGLTVVMATHDMDMAVEEAETLVILNGGRVELMGDPLDVLNDSETIENLGLRLPRVTSLFKRLQAEGIFFEAPLPLTIETAVERLKEHLLHR